jgi:hypothetical protein
MVRLLPRHHIALRLTNMLTTCTQFRPARRALVLLLSIICFGFMVSIPLISHVIICESSCWIIGRTRFAQARAELGMTDRTGGGSSLNYTHRRRPENYEEDKEEGSDGEDVARLKARAGDPHHPPGDDEELRLQSQDLTLARELRLRAEGLEKVVTSMLEQPPPLPPHNDEDIWTPPTSPRVQSFTFKDFSNPHSLPNGVRLRLALGTMVNDLFARQAPPPPYRHQHKHAKPGTPSTQVSGLSSGHSSGQSSSGSILYAPNTILPPALAFLSTISAVHAVPPPAYSTGPSSFPGYTPQSVIVNFPFPLTALTNLLVRVGSVCNSRHLHPVHVLICSIWQGQIQVLPTPLPHSAVLVICIPDARSVLKQRLHVQFPVLLAVADKILLGQAIHGGECQAD